MAVACDMPWSGTRCVVVVMLSKMKMCRFVLVVQALEAKAVAVASACLFFFVRGLVKSLSYIILSITLILTHTPDWRKTGRMTLDLLRH